MNSSPKLELIVSAPVTFSKSQSTPAVPAKLAISNR
ncbi:MAG: hypothetical protein PCFJNLEI_00968 [Verrucomicrobiae bacterium]|nr:hypothetical protein [Verrucomicrobiae bacterium]